MFTLFDISLSNIKLDASSWEFSWKHRGAVHVGKSLLGMLKSQVNEEFLPVNSYCIYVVLLLVPRSSL